jgi:hypothetical protein
MVVYFGWFDESGQGYAEVRREIWEPGTVAFSYKVKTAEVSPTLYTDAGPYVLSAIDPYIVMPSEAEFEYPVLQ